jgi:hypothetical protein
MPMPMPTPMPMPMPMPMPLHSLVPTATDCPKGYMKKLDYPGQVQHCFSDPSHTPEPSCIHTGDENGTFTCIYTPSPGLVISNTSHFEPSSDLPEWNVLSNVTLSVHRSPPVQGLGRHRIILLSIIRKC